MNRKLRKYLAIMLAASMALSSMPSGVMAEETEAVTEAAAEKSAETIVTKQENVVEEKTEEKKPEIESIDGQEETKPEKETKETSVEEIEPETVAGMTETEQETATEAITEAEEATEAEPEPDPEKSKVEDTVKTGKVSVLMKTPGGKVKISASGQTYEVVYAETGEAFVLEEAEETVAQLEVTAEEGYEIGTYKVTMDSGTVEEKHFDSKARSFTEELEIKAEKNMNVEVWFQATEESKSESDAETEGESEAEMETETKTEVEAGTEAETETETEIETGQEIKEIQKYHLYFSGDDTYSVSVDGQDGYSSGELVKAAVAPVSDDYEILTISMREVAYQEEDSSLEGEDDLIGLFFDFGSPVPFEVTDVSEDGIIFTEFRMPEADVYLEVVAGEKGSGIMLLDVDLEDDLPDGGYFVPGNSIWYAYPSKFADSSYGTSTKQMYIYKDGEKIGTVDGYCIQASLSSPESGTVSMSNKLTKGAEEDLAKALFYLYGGPGWDTTFQGKDGKSYNFKDIFKNTNGLTNGTSFSMSHIILSKLYWDFCDSQEMSTNWSWNAGWTKGDYGTEKTNVLTDEGKDFVNEIVDAIKQLDFPECKLSETTFSASQISTNPSTGRFRTPTITYTSIPENTLKITLSGGMVVVNETTGAETTSGTAVINGGDKFHFELPKQSTTARHASYTGTCSLFGAFRSWRYRHTSAGGQAVGFSYTSSDNSFTFDITWPEVPYTPVRVKKISAGTGITSGNGMYSLAGAVFELRNSEGAVVATFTTDANGDTTAVDVEAGSYTLVETAAPQGYKKAGNVAVSITAGQAEKVITVADEPIVGTAGIAIRKQTSVGNDHPMDGVEFKVEYFDNAAGIGIPKRIWNLKTVKDKTGDYSIRLTEECFVSGDGFYKNTAGETVVPLGVLVYTETKAKEGFKLDSTPIMVPVTEGAGNADTIVATKEILNDQLYGGVRIDKGSILQGQTPDGDASFAGAVFEIVNNSDWAVTISGSSDITYAKGRVVAEIVTGEDGIAELSFDDPNYALEAGAQHIIREKTAPEGYLNDGKPITFTVVADTTLDLTGTLITDTPIMGGFRQEKRDAKLNDTGKSQGNAILEGAKFELYNSSKSSVVVDGKTYAVNAKIAEFTTNAEGVVETPSNYLPYGTYTLQEVTPPEGYTSRGENLSVTFKIQEDGKIVDLAENTAAKNEPIRFDITIMKFKDTLSSEDPGDDLVPLEGVVFDIYLKSTGEKVASITTDEDGVATTVDKENFPHGRLPYGVYVVKEVEHPADIHPVADFEVDGTRSGNVYDGKEYKGIYKNDRPVEEYIQIRKADAETGKIIPTGAEFQILDENKEVVEFKILTPHLEKITNFITDETGTVALPERLKYGTYYLHEVNAPEGYLQGKDVEFHVTTTNSWENVITVNFTDEAAKGKLRIGKYDNDTKEKLSGAVFHVFAKDDIVTGDGTIRNAKGELVDIITIGADGTGTSKELYLGKYYFQEAKAPEGYCLDTKQYSFDLVYQDQVTSVIYADKENYNKPTTLKVYKKDVDGEAMDGVSFRITRLKNLDSSDVSGEKGIDGDTFVSADGGMLTVKYLVPGLYSIKEIQTLSGYVLDEAVKYFVVDENGFIFESDQEGRNLSPDDAKSDTEIITWVNDYTKWDFSKVNVNGDKELPGAEMSIVDEAGNEVYSWTSTEEVHRITKIPLGNYTLVEKVAPEGYVIASEIPFEVTNTGVVQKVTVTDKVVSMSKVDMLGRMLSGAKFAVYEVTEADGEKITGSEVIDTWITGETEHAICGLKVGGTYRLVELEAPEGYVLADPVEFTVPDDKQDQSVTVIDKQVLVSKVDTEVLQLAGAHLEVRDSQGEVIDRWISDGTLHAIRGLKIGETYTLVETKAPEGYAIAAPIIFTVSENAENEEIRLINKQVLVHKTDLTGEKEIPGAKLTVTEKETGAVVDKWTSEGSPHPVSGIEVGKTYVLHETTAPAGYVTASEIEFTVLDDFKVQHVVMKDDITRVEITKTDLTNGKLLPGAELIIRDSEGNEVERWITEDVPHYIEKLPVGTYTLEELTAPDGYVTAEIVPFTVLDTGEIQRTEMQDEVTKVEITKTDLTNGEFLPGAELIIRDSEGNEVKRWITEDVSYYIEKLPVGTYTLEELTAPDGYVTAETVPFTVLDTGELQRTEMQDEVTKVEITKTDLVNGKPVEGAELVIKDSDGNEVERWITTKEPYYLEMLPVGEYTLTEISAPKGYEIAETVKFTVEDTGEIQKVNMKDKLVTPVTSTEVPKTGDTANLVLYLVLAVVSLAVIALIWRRRRRAT